MSDVAEPIHEHTFHHETGEHLATPQIILPASIELFEAGTGKPNHLSPTLSENLQLTEQAAKRRSLYEAFRAFFSQSIDINQDVLDACLQGEIEVEKLTALYTQLSAFLLEDSNNARILLYLPFQLLPHRENDVFLGEKYAKAASHLQVVIKNAWIQLLHEHEPRASYVDGDILEPGMGEPERIIKAGHLVPELLVRGIIQCDDIVDVLQTTNDTMLFSSLAEGCIVATDTNIISQADLDRMHAIPAFVQALEEADERSKEAPHQEVGADDLDTLEAQYSPDSPYRATMSYKRAEWGKKVKRNHIIDVLAENISQEIQTGELSIDTLDSSNTMHVRALFMTGEAYSKINIHNAQTFADGAQAAIDLAWQIGTSEIHNEVISGLSHWYHLGIDVAQLLKRFDINVPDLSLPFPIDLDGRDRDIASPLIEAAADMASDPILAENLYPFFLTFGSRLKGYAELGADLDAAIIVKPHVSLEQREALLHRLHDKVPELAQIDQLLEFWTEEKQDGIGFRAVPEGIRNIVGALQVHFVLGGAWIGQGEAMKSVYRDIVNRYVNLYRFGEQKDDVRRHLLRQMELDVLQVRLMHKGYRRYYPSMRPEGTAHSKAIDWESDYWDPGYRRIATQLFLSRVFLPDIDEEK